MKIVSTNDIKEIFWNPIETIYPSLQVEKSYQSYNQEIRIDQIYFWEEIYRQPGNFGIYAAVVPMIEVYVIVYELFRSPKKRYQMFFGKNAEQEIYKYCKKLGVDLKTRFKNADENSSGVF
jgi:hypothetical protein